MKITDLMESSFPSESLEDMARSVEFDNADEGTESRHPPEDAIWNIEAVPTTEFIGVLGSVEKWKKWYENELHMLRDDGLDSYADAYQRMIDGEDIKD